MPMKVCFCYLKMGVLQCKVPAEMITIPLFLKKNWGGDIFSSIPYPSGGPILSNFHWQISLIMVIIVSSFLTLVPIAFKHIYFRFINHSCDPNCYSKIVEILGKKHIIIFSLRYNKLYLENLTKSI